MEQVPLFYSLTLIIFKVKVFVFPWFENVLPMVKDRTNITIAIR